MKSCNFVPCGKDEYCGHPCDGIKAVLSELKSIREYNNCTLSEAVDIKIEREKKKYEHRLTLINGGK